MAPDQRSRLAKERALFARLEHDSTGTARAAIVERFLPLVRHIARRYDNGDEPFEDLVQVGSVGLLKAIDRFDPRRGLAFSSLAVPTIAGEIKRHFRDRTWAVRAPRHLQEVAWRMRQIQGSLEAELGRVPTAAELADALGVSIEELLEARTASAAQYADSLDQQRGGDESEGLSRVDAFAVEDRNFRAVDDAVTLAQLQRCLDDREREILRLRFEEDLLQSEIAEIIGCSQMHVSRLLQGALNRLSFEAIQLDGSGDGGDAQRAFSRISASAA